MVYKQILTFWEIVMGIPVKNVQNNFWTEKMFNPIYMIVNIRIMNQIFHSVYNQMLDLYFIHFSSLRKTLYTY